MAVIKKIVTRVVEDVEKWEFSYTTGENVRWCSYIGKQSSSSSNDLNRELPYDPKILLGMHPREKTAMNSHSSIIHNGQKVETTKLSTN